MAVNYTFKKFLNPAALAGRLNKMAPLHTLVMDLVYPASVQVNHPFDTIGYEDLAAVCKNIPLVTRGGQSYSLSPDGNVLRYIDPANLNPSCFVKAADINRLRNLPGQGVQVYMDGKIERLRRATRLSKEAMAIQSLTGKISYDLATENGGVTKYEVDFGSIRTYTPAVKWDAAGATAGKMIADIGGIIAEIKKKSLATKFVAFVSYETFGVMCDLASGAKGNLPISVTPEKINVAGVDIYPTAASYYDYSTGQAVPLVAAKKIKVVGVDDGFQFFNCALDSIDADFAGIPFGIREVPKDDPEGIKLIGMARPMPIPNVNAICDATVLQ